MRAMTFATAHCTPADTTARVCEDHEPVIITSEADQAVVMLSLEDYNALLETAHLARSPTNARRLPDAITELERGAGTERKILDRINQLIRDGIRGPFASIGKLEPFHGGHDLDRAGAIPRLAHRDDAHGAASSSHPSKTDT